MPPVSCAVPKDIARRLADRKTARPGTGWKRDVPPDAGAPPTKPPAIVVPEPVVNTPETAWAALPLTKPEISPPAAPPAT